MNVVWVKAEKKKDAQKGYVVNYTIYNYTMQERTIGIHAQLPKSCVNLTLFSNPHFVNNMTEDGKVMWEVKGIQPSASLTISFELKGELADTFDANDVYISGINSALVMGADALPGDWGIKGLEITESEEPVPAEEEEAEEEVEDLGDE